MLTPRDTPAYKPIDYKYGRGTTDTPVVKDKRKGATKPSSRSDVIGWRDSNDYRRQYFERNKGIGGYGYICSQCWKPMFKKENIQVDHIIPPSKLATKKVKKIKSGPNKGKEVLVKTSMMARFLNNSFNCAAICPDCNRRKSDKIDHRVFHGYAMKSLEVAYGASQLLLSIPFMAVAFGMWGVRKVISKVISSRRKGKKR